MKMQLFSLHDLLDAMCISSAYVCTGEWLSFFASHFCRLLVELPVGSVRRQWLYARQRNETMLMTFIS